MDNIATRIKRYREAKRQRDVTFRAAMVQAIKFGTVEEEFKDRLERIDVLVNALRERCIAAIELELDAYLGNTTIRTDDAHRAAQRRSELLRLLTANDYRSRTTRASIVNSMAVLTAQANEHRTVRKVRDLHVLLVSVGRAIADLIV